MDPITILSLASAAMALAKQAMPLVRDAINGGQLSAEDEAKARAEYESLRGQLGGEYEGSHWQLSGR
jgi:hypothetical protein